MLFLFQIGLALALNLFKLPVVMRVFLLILVVLTTTTHAKEAPVYWQYPGPFGARLEAAFASIKGTRDAHQLISDADRRTYIRQKLKTLKVGGCLEDDGRCASESLAILESFGLAGRVMATARRTDLGYEIQLLFESSKHKSVRKFTAEATKLEQAAQEVLNALHGQGTLSLAVTPPDAFFFLNDIPFGQGSGDHLITTGTYQLRVEAPGYKAETMPLEITTGERVRANVILVEAAAQLSLKTQPSGARVFLDGELWKTPETQKAIRAGTHILKVEREGYKTFEKTVDLKPSTVVNLELKLVPSDPPWRRAIKTKISDTNKLPVFVTSGWSFLSVRDREYDVGTTLSKLTEMKAPLGGQKFAFGISTRKENLLIDLLKVDYLIASGTVPASMTGVRDSARVTDLSRLIIAPAWIGMQHPIWRFMPYATGGLLIQSETVNGEVGDARFSGDHVEVDLGLELGLRYAFSEQLFAGVAHRIDGLIGEGTTLSLGFQIGYAFDLPSQIKRYLP